MTQFSMLPWETITGTGDGIASYNQLQANNFFRYFDVRDPSNEGVAYGVLNQLEVTGAAFPLSVDSGAAVCYGRYWNDASTTVTASLPAANTGGRVVVQTDWSTNTTRLSIILSASGVTTPPVLTQTPGVTYELSLYSFIVSAAGAVSSLVDERVFLKGVQRGSFELIQSFTTTAGQSMNTFNLSNIPQYFRDLYIRMSVALNAAATTTTPSITFNSSAVGYTRHQTVFSNGSVACTVATGHVSGLLGSIGGQTPANNIQPIELFIPHYSQALFHKHCYGSTLRVDGGAAANYVKYDFWNRWSGTGAITSVQFSSGVLIAGSVCEVYGIG